MESEIDNDILLTCQMRLYLCVGYDNLSSFTFPIHRHVWCKYRHVRWTEEPHSLITGERPSVESVQSTHPWTVVTQPRRKPNARLRSSWVQLTVFVLVTLIWRSPWSKTTIDAAPVTDLRSCSFFNVPFHLTTKQCKTINTTPNLHCNIRDDMRIFT